MSKAASKPAAGRKSATSAKPRSTAKPTAKTAPAVKVVKAAAKSAKSVKSANAPVRRATSRQGQTGEVLSELKSLAKELNKAAKDLGKASSENPKTVANILGSVERMTNDAANKSLQGAEAAKQALDRLKDSLGRDWSRKDIEAALKVADGHLTNIIVAQEFQDLAGQAIRKAMKALVGAIIVVEGGGSTEDNRLSQNEVDNLLNDLMP